MLSKLPHLDHHEGVAYGVTLFNFYSHCAHSFISTETLNETVESLSATVETSLIFWTAGMVAILERIRAIASSSVIVMTAFMVTT